MRDKHALIQAARAVVNGSPVDWSRIRAEATTDDLRSLLEALETLERISRSRLESAGDATPSDACAAGNMVSGHRIQYPLEEDLVTARYAILREGTRAPATLLLVKWDVDVRSALCLHAELASRLRGLPSPPILPTRTAGVTPEGRLFFVEPRVLGQTMSERTAGRGSSLEHRRDLAKQAISAVDVAHRGGLVHGGLTPRSFWSPDVPGTLWLAGLGLVHCVDIRCLELRVANALGRDFPYPRYFAPELLADRRAGLCTTADVYALAALIEDLVPYHERSQTLRAILAAARDPRPDARPRDAIALLALLDQDD